MGSQKANGSGMSSSQINSSQLSQTQTQSRTKEPLDPVEKEIKINEIVQYMLVMDQKKFPIKKRDIKKTVLKECSGHYAELMTHATNKLSQVFGFRVVELKDKAKDSYILVNEISNDVDKRHLVCSDEDNAKMGLLTIILGMIFMNGDIIHEEDLWYALKKLGIVPEQHHSTFGNVKKLILEDFVRQGYLEVIPQPNTDPQVKDFFWGQRAKHEFKKHNALMFVSKICKTAPEAFRPQWLQVMKEQGHVAMDVDVDEAGPSSRIR